MNKTMVNWLTIRFGRAELINNDDFPFPKIDATQTKQRMHMGSPLKRNIAVTQIISNSSIFIGCDLKMIQDDGVERILSRPKKKTQNRTQFLCPIEKLLYCNFILYNMTTSLLPTEIHFLSLFSKTNYPKVHLIATN